MNANKYVAIMAAILMIACPLIVFANDFSAADDETKEYGTSVEFDSISAENIGKYIQVPVKTDGKAIDKAAPYIAMVLFPGIDSAPFIGAEFDSILTNNFALKIDAYNAQNGDKTVAKAAVTLSSDSVNFFIKGVEGKILTENKGCAFESIFSDSDYASELKTLFGSDVYNGDSVIVKGSISIKVYFETEYTATTIDEEKYITEGGLNLAVLKEIPPISDVRVEVKSDLKATINGKEVEFRTETTAIAQFDLKYDYDLAKFDCRIGVESLKFKVSEKATVSYDGKDFDNNSVALDLSDNVKALLDGRFIKAESVRHIAGITVGEIKYSDIIRIVNDTDPEQAAKNIVENLGGTCTKDASEVSKKIDTVADEIIPAGQEDLSFKIFLGILAIVVLIGAAYYILTKKKGKKKE